jgi:hypothetical protein
LRSIDNGCGWKFDRGNGRTVRREVSVPQADPEDIDARGSIVVLQGTPREQKFVARGSCLTDDVLDDIALKVIKTLK